MCNRCITDAAKLATSHYMVIKNKKTVVKCVSCGKWSALQTVQGKTGLNKGKQMDQI